MRVLVLKPFREKGKPRVYRPGQYIDVSKERMERINTHDTFLVEAKAKAKPQKTGE